MFKKHNKVFISYLYRPNTASLSHIIFPDILKVFACRIRGLKTNKKERVWSVE